MSERYPGGFVTKTPPTPSVASAQGIWTLEQAAEYIRAGTWPYPPQPDAQWNYVTALFAGTSTSGAQNNTFLDSSSNGFTITRNGNTTQGSFSPYQTNGYWSNYFDGSGDYLSVPNNSALAYGTGDFTVEFWINRTGAVSSSDAGVIDQRNGSNGSYFMCGIDTNQQFFVYLNSAYRVGPSASTNLAVGTWYHIAYVRSGTTGTLYINGNSVGSWSDNLNYITNTVLIGRHANGGTDFPGYLSNIRILKGTALYTSSFTPPTSPLTAITNTSLLTCQSNRFIDNSASPLTITVNGNTSVQDFSPLGVTTPYSPQTIGGSGYFDGTGDYLTVADAAGLEIGNEDFTIECWVYLTAGSNFQYFISKGTNTDFVPYQLIIDNTNKPAFYASTNGSSFAASLVSSATMALNSWNHLAVCRVGSAVTLYLNGASVATGTVSGALFDNTRAVGIGGGSTGTNLVTGYLASARIVKGTAVYTAAFTPPTSPLTAISGTALLANFTNAGIFDAAAANNAETVGNAQVSTTVMKYGPSLYFDGTGDWLIAPSTPNCSFETGNFTLEGWIYPTATTGTDRVIWDTRATSGDAGMVLFIDTSGKLSTYTSSAIRLTSTNAVTANTWQHFALVRSGGTMAFYIDGVQNGTLSYSTAITCPGSVRIGVRQDGTQPYTGYIYNLRITKGYARYWYPFTPPLVPMGTYYAPEVLPAADPLFKYVTMLLPGNGTNGAQNNTFTDSSTNNFTITRNGNTTQGTFSPYGSNWSNYFDGTGDRLSATSNAAFGMGTGDFTVEAWIYPTVAFSGFQAIFADGNVTGSLYFGNTTGGFGLRAGSVGDILVATAPSINQWTHVAVTRSGTTARLFYNGVQQATTTNSTNFPTQAANIGDDGGGSTFTGYISNLRLVKGTAVYTAAFTPSTAPLTAITNTSLLTCQSNRFIDNSSNAFTITRNGDVSVQRFSPFAPTAAYSAATIGGSGYFDGSGDSLDTGTTGVSCVLTGDFTVEAWVYPTDWGYYPRVISGGASTFYWSLGFSTSWGGGLKINWYDGTDYYSSAYSPGSPLNTWYHIAVVRTGSTIYYYINGVQYGSSSYSATPGNANGGFEIGDRVGATEHWVGYITDARVVVGTNVYGTGATITIPTAPLTAVTNTRLLLNFTNAGIIDNAMMNDLETVGDAQISTTQSKFGGSSLYFDGTGDWLKIPNSQNFNFGSGSFTLEGWVYCTNTAPRQDIFASPSNGSGFNGLTLHIYNGQFELTMSWTGGWDILFAGAGAISVNTWTHFAVVRNGGTVTVYVNGTSTYSNAGLGTNALIFGTDSASISYGRVNQGDARFLNGYIDDFRITKGIARYVQPFTPPTQAFQTS